MVLRNSACVGENVGGKLGDEVGNELGALVGDNVGKSVGALLDTVGGNVMAAREHSTKHSAMIKRR